VACIPTAHQVAPRFGERTCGAAVSREPLKQQSPGARHAGAHQLRGPAAPPTIGAPVCFSAGAGLPAPNNRLQWMRGRACFGRRKGLRVAPHH
jgi:hypothetical protein